MVICTMITNHINHCRTLLSQMSTYPSLTFYLEFQDNFCLSMTASILRQYILIFKILLFSEYQGRHDSFLNLALDQLGSILSLKNVYLYTFFSERATKKIVGPKKIWTPNRLLIRSAQGTIHNRPHYPPPSPISTALQSTTAY